MHTDFLVIGGGIAGVSAGARLACLGRVCLLEGEEALGYHASGRSAALFEQTYGLPSTLALNAASAAYHWSADGGMLSARGLMLLGDAETVPQFEKDLATMHMEEIGLEAALQLVPILNPDFVTRVGHHTEAFDIDTDRLIQHFARAIRANGEVELGVRVDRITRIDGGWRVTSGARDWTARVLVNAAGAWADVVAQMAGLGPIGLTPLRRSMARLAAPGGHDVRTWPMIFGPGETWYAKPDAGALLVSPAEEDVSAPMDAWADDMVLAEGLARYQENVTVEVTRPIATWAGLRSFSPDRNLVLGPDPQDDSFVWVAGQGGYGFQTAPAASQLIADMMAGRPSELGADVVAALSPARFAR